MRNAVIVSRLMEECSTLGLLPHGSSSQEGHTCKFGSEVLKSETRMSDCKYKLPFPEMFRRNKNKQSVALVLALNVLLLWRNHRSLICFGSLCFSSNTSETWIKGFTYFD